MRGGFGGPKYDEIIAVVQNDFRQIIAFEWRHMTRAAPGTVVITGAGPFVLPDRIAAVADIVIAKPGHESNPRRIHVRS